jgi:hypothetical protein
MQNEALRVIVIVTVALGCLVSVPSQGGIRRAKSIVFGVG